MKKAKQDFCFPFYFQRYLSGTMGFTPEMHGAYLLAMIYQFQNGHFSEADINRVIDGKFEIIKHKYALDENNLYFNETMEEIIIERKNFVESRRNNRLGKTKDKRKNNTSSSSDKLEGGGSGDGVKGVVTSKEKKYKHLTKVLLTATEYTKLIDKFGEVGTQQRIQNLNEYIESKGVKYKSHYHTILMWERKNAPKSTAEAMSEKHAGALAFARKVVE